VQDVVVVDNNSGDDSREALAVADPEARYVQTGVNLGYGGGANRGAAETDADLFLVSNADVVVEPGTVKALIAAAERDPRVAIVGPRIVDPDGTLYPSPRTFPSMTDSLGHAFLGMPFPNNRFTRRYRMLDWDHSQTAEVDWVSGSCFLARRAAWAELGGFDSERYFMYAEDVDLCWRARQQGWKVVFEPAGVAIHTRGASTNHHPYRMILEHHRALLRFAVRSSRGLDRVLLPVVAVGLVVRTLLAWSQRAWVTRRAK
jgi:N-acetylglucosaminyl-diphospho-decaprenol L-rhamnosyltransferase